VSIKLTFETIDDDTFVHIESTSGVIGHAQEVIDSVPSGTWLTMPIHLARLTPWLVKKCGFKYVARILHEHEVIEILKKE